jgi:glycosyltransferase involved in cell wall biosynthesis
MQEVLAGALCFVLPTRGDTSPNSVKEARVVGLPVVTSAHGGQSGYILNGQNGCIVDPLTSEGIAEALDRIMTDPDLARRMGAERHQHDREYFMPDNTANGFRRIYRELLGD